MKVWDAERVTQSSIHSQSKSCENERDMQMSQAVSPEIEQASKTKQTPTKRRIVIRIGRREPKEEEKKRGCANEVKPSIGLRELQGYLR
jgi:hypothetical protein